MSPPRMALERGAAAAPPRSPRRSALHVRPELLRRRSAGSAAAEGGSQHIDSNTFDELSVVVSPSLGRGGPGRGTKRTDRELRQALLNCPRPGPRASSYAGAYVETDKTRSLEKRIYGALQPGVLPRPAPHKRCASEATLVWSAPIDGALSAVTENTIRPAFTRAAATRRPSVAEMLRAEPPRTVREFVSAVR